MNPEWITAVGVVSLGVLRPAWDVWRHRGEKAKREPERPDDMNDDPPALAA